MAYFLKSYKNIKNLRKKSLVNFGPVYFELCCESTYL